MSTERQLRTPEATLLVASNRGPAGLTRGPDGAVVASRGGGGLVAGLSGALHGRDALWVCAAMSADDRRVAQAALSGRIDLAGHATGGPAVRMLVLDEAVFADAYGAVANSTLWFVHHLLYATPTQPVFDARFAAQWTSYVSYNCTFADALADEAAPGAKVLVQDYHLSLVPLLLRRLRPDLRIGHFSHVPWAPSEYFSLLPDAVAIQLLEGMLGADSAGFLSPRWAAAFLDCCARVLEARVDRISGIVEHAGRRTTVAVHPLGVDAGHLRARAAEADVEQRRAALLEQVGGQRLIVRVDRAELSKNAVRGLLAFRELLQSRPQWRGRVTHLALSYPSRQDLADYRAYGHAVRSLAEEINDEFTVPGWQPVVLHLDDDFPRSLAAYRIADVLLVNPIRDGMNLVAKEGPVVAERPAPLVLSTEAGAAVEFDGDALLVNPYDVSATAQALHTALVMPPAERRARAKRLVAIAGAVPPRRWLDEQIGALERLTPA